MVVDDERSLRQVWGSRDANPKNKLLEKVQNAENTVWPHLRIFPVKLGRYAKWEAPTLNWNLDEGEPEGLQWNFIKESEYLRSPSNSCPRPAWMISTGSSNCRKIEKKRTRSINLRGTLKTKRQVIFSKPHQ